MRHIIMVWLFVGACWLPRATPGDYRGITVTYPHGDSDAALAIVRTEYAHIYPGAGVELATMTVMWTDDHCPGSVSTGILYQDKCYAGLMWSCQEMYVAYRDRISGSAFTHEIGHCVYYLAYGHGDITHSDLDFWAQNAAVNELVRQAGY